MGTVGVTYRFYRANTGLWVVPRLSRAVRCAQLVKYHEGVL